MEAAQKAAAHGVPGEHFTLKKCPPVIDAMTYGFLMPLAADLKLENGEFSWQTDWPGGEFANIFCAKLGFTDEVSFSTLPEQNNAKI